MPIDKPVNNITGASVMHSVKRARDSAPRRGLAMDAALGLDSFARLLREENSAGRSSAQVAPHLRGARQRSGGADGEAVPDTRSLRALQAAQEAMLMAAQPRSLPAQARPEAAVSRSQGSEGAVLALRAAGHKVREAASTALEGLGKLSALFESGKEGSAAIGYDKTGGTSYGQYQIASNTGTMDEFIAFLEKQAPRLARVLKKAGPANTGSREGRMPEAWRAVNAKDPKGFAGLQQSFIQERLYEPALEKLRGAGLNDKGMSRALREVLFSTAVQHGPSGAAAIIGKALRETAASAGESASPAGGPAAESRKTEGELIERIYALRKERFGSSSPEVRKAVAARLQNERDLALDMLALDLDHSGA